MASHLFLLGSALSAERLSWIADALKICFVNRIPESFRGPHTGQEPAVSFFLTGDALHSLHERETLPFWESILSLPSVRVTCDREEMDLRGLSLDSLRMKYPGTLLDQNGRRISHPRSFWRGLVQAARRTVPGATALGYLLLESPYMNRAPVRAISCLLGALEEGLTADLYAYLDGVHAGHMNQKPSERRNIGKGIEELDAVARKRGLPFQVLACESCAAARGYCTWDDGRGISVSTCAIGPMKIRNLGTMAGRFSQPRVILGETGGLVSLERESRPVPDAWLGDGTGIPPVLILVTHSPYETDYSFGALTLAIACAHLGIPTRVVFLEDGVYALSGTHSTEPDDLSCNIQDIADAADGTGLQLYAFLPSLHARSLEKNPRFTAVYDIGMKEFEEILFSTPKGAGGNHQRILFF
ncbi:MAG TPA: DsrE family protein [Methanomicrobiales archaeon]|nr:DsrE family protein [Methanomicrobiales archaeon]